MKIRHLALALITTATLSACAQHGHSGLQHRPDDSGKAALKGLQQSTETEVQQWWSFPLPGAKVISPFGSRGGRRHTGVDLKTINKDEILAAFDGEVVFSSRFSGYGNLVRLRHDNGLETYYSHNSKNLVKVGEQVKAGQVIALTGQTGRASTPHLHFETRIGGQAVNPNRFFDLQNYSIRMEAFNKKVDGYVIKR